MGGVETLEYDDATCDVVLSHQALQYIADPLVAMNAMAPVTKAGGLKPGVAGIVRIGAAHAAVAALLSISACATPPDAAERSGPRWLAGDHHIHSRYSVGWNRATDPPAPIVAGDAIYPIPLNALMARHYGLGWMVATDHGGPNHSKVNLERAYPELVQSREVVPEIIQFFGMEFDTPGAEHSSLIIPHTHDEAERLHQIESSYATREPWPPDPGWDTPSRMLEALAAIRDFPASPVVIVNHPSRSATDLGVYGPNSPSQLRDWNDAAPEVAVGMAGAPGHQASTLNPDGTLDPGRPRGGYGLYPTLGGFDQMTARLGGFWDSMLGEGRRWWITANSDSHVNWREGGSDFWPGEYSKTYVWAERTHDAILEGIRGGRIFVTTGDLISELSVTARVKGGGVDVQIGGQLDVPAGGAVDVTVRFLDPATPNSHGDEPSVSRVDIIAGDVTGPVTDRSTDTNLTTRVVARFGENDWTSDGPYRGLTFRLENVSADSYLRVRGTDGSELEPEPDPWGEDPWSNLWFYSNPIFLHVR